MIEKMISLAITLLKFSPFLLFIFLDTKVNLKKELRSRQFLMPIAALIYCLIMLRYMDRIGVFLIDLLNMIPALLTRLREVLETLLDGELYRIIELLNQLIVKVEEFLANLNIKFALIYILNAAIMLFYIIVKKILVSIMKGIFKTGNRLYEAAVGHFYGHDEVGDRWFLLSHIGQGRTYLKTFFIASVVISMGSLLAAMHLYKDDLLTYPFYPVFGIIVIGELYFFVCGKTKQEMDSEIAGEEDQSEGKYNYVVLRQILRKLFGDKLTTEDTTVCSEETDTSSTDELLIEMERSDDRKIEAYGKYMRKRLNAGMELDKNYLRSGLDLLNKKSILFNNPFYYDLIPYIFYAMDRMLLKHKKVLIILGRHGIEEDVKEWCREGLRAISNILDMWKIEVLSEETTEQDIGIITRSDVQNLKLHESNQEFFEQVQYVVLIEPSKLITTAQIGLNSLIRHCHAENKEVTYCSMDKNCDGLVDALSHVLMTSLVEVSATAKHQGTCSYMCWAPDQDYLQHRMLPNVARYLGVGTELSFVALKNQVSQATWYGGEAFPVQDMRWIVRQYYYDLLSYAGLPTNQETLDKYFTVSPNMWDERRKDLSYLTVEDEAYNMFEVKRCFSTRAKEQSFINVITSEYLLRDYMAENDKIFDADPKAIPYIVADYARTSRNVVFRLCLRMSAGYLDSKELSRELMLINASTEELIDSLWHEICLCAQPIGSLLKDDAGNEILRRVVDGKEYSFDKKIILTKRKYSFKTGKMEDLYTIEDHHFKRLLLSDLQNAQYIAEEEDGESSFLGMELRGHVFQKYLPGQFFVFNGKYYEMLSVTSDGQVLVRRAADHITGRPEYRQVRKYFISNAVDSDAMGTCKNIGGLRITRQFADIRVETPAYWQMNAYNDFENGQKVTINGIPDREYCNKQILRIDFPEEGEAFTKEIRYTLTLLFNELFRTMFAENQSYIVAVTPGECEIPITYELAGEKGFALDENAIYILEDSQLDIGLLVAVERNLNRIFSILCDYLDWHLETLDKSLNPPPQGETPVYTVTEPVEDEPKTIWGKIWRAIKKFFKKIGAFFKKIKDFFKKIFKKKSKNPEEKAPKEKKPKKEKKRRKKKGEQTPEAAEGITPEGGEAAGGSGAEAVEATEPQPESVTAEEPKETGSEASNEESPALSEEESPKAPDEEGSESEPEEKQEEPSEEKSSEEEQSEEEQAEEEQARESDYPVLMSIRYLYNEAQGTDTEQVQTATEPEGEASAPDSDTETVKTPEGGELEFEPEKVIRRGGNDNLPKERKPYHERYYLLFGGRAVSEQLDLAGTMEFLQRYGYGNGFLKQARNGKDIAEMIEKNYEPNKAGSHYCDFCDIELTGTEYDVLSDGRERCPACGRTAVKTAAEFEKIYNSIVKNMELFYGVRITVPVKVEMVNSKKLHKRLGKTFVPTGKPDARVLGVAIRDKKNNYSILVENGAPKLASIMTIAHELTHIWQYLNWNGKAIRAKYGAEQELEIYEGMAKWSEIQYAYLIGEPATAKREEMITRIRPDEYGRGFNKYVSKYPLTPGTHLKGITPFSDPTTPL